MAATLSGYRWAPGTITKAALTAALYAIENFTRQSDMEAWRQWLRPSNESDIIDEDGEIVTAMTGEDFGYGEPDLKWGLRALTPKMVAYINSSRFPSSVRSYPATLRTPNRATGAGEYYHAIATKSAYSSAQAALGGLDLWIIVFRDAVLFDTD